MFNILFWILIGIIIYAYLGYTLTLLIINSLKRKTQQADTLRDDYLPTVTHVIAIYNELDILPNKVANSQSLDYPADKIQHLWITDGSNDGSNDYLNKNTNDIVLHSSERLGKTAALNRAMQHVNSEITVFSDANTTLSANSIKNLTTPFITANIGCVAGEKKVIAAKKDTAAASGEGIYWNYESIIKKLEADFYSTMGAVGELYAIRSELFQPQKQDTILDDFLVSMSILQNGYRISYAPNACASENSSYNINEEMKRKIRIAAGGFQVLFRKPQLLNFFKHPKLSFQYLSHKVLRWLIVPICFPLLYILNCYIIYDNRNLSFYSLFFLLQSIFYLFALLGYALRNNSIRFKALFIPYYITIMNISQVIGFFRYIGGKQHAAWDKAKRNS